MEFSQNLHLAHLQLLMSTSAKFKLNWTETVGGVVQTSIFKSNQGQFSQNLRLAHLQLLMNTSAKYQANWTETVGGVVQTRFFGQTDHPTDERPPDRLIPVYPPNLCLRGYKNAYKQHFLLYPQCFLSYKRQKSPSL